MSVELAFNAETLRGVKLAVIVDASDTGEG